MGVDVYARTSPIDKDSHAGKDGETEDENENEHNTSVSDNWLDKGYRRARVSVIRLPVAESLFRATCVCLELAGALGWKVSESHFWILAVRLQWTKAARMT